VTGWRGSIRSTSNGATRRKFPNAFVAAVPLGPCAKRENVKFGLRLPSRYGTNTEEFY